MEILQKETPKFSVEAQTLEGTPHTCRANAAHIIQCVNAHDALVSSLTETTAMLKAMSQLVHEFGILPDEQGMAASIIKRAALALAKKGA